MVMGRLVRQHQESRVVGSVAESFPEPHIIGLAN